MVNLGLHSSGAGPIRVVSKLVHTPNVKWINLQDKKALEAELAKIITTYPRMDNSRQTFEV